MYWVFDEGKRKKERKGVQRADKPKGKQGVWRSRPVKKKGGAKMTKEENGKGDSLRDIGAREERKDCEACLDRRGLQ